MDLSTVTNATELKALAYDCLATINQAQQDLNKIEIRLKQLQQVTPEKNHDKTRRR